MINNVIHGNGWGDQVFEYFEGELLDKEFPAPDSRSGLQLTSYGGALVCVNGNHRVVAACCWLVSNGITHFKKVNTNVVDVDFRKIDLLVRLWEKNNNLVLFELKDSVHSSNPKYIAKIKLDNEKYNLYLMGETAFEKLPVELGFCEKLFGIGDSEKRKVVDEYQNYKGGGLVMTEAVYYAWKSALSTNLNDNDL